MAYTQQQLDEIQHVQETRSLTRKSAVQYCTRLWKKAAAAQQPQVEAAPKPVKAAKKSSAQPEERRKKAKPTADGKRMGPPTTKEAKEIVKLYKGGDGMSIPDLAAKFGTRDRGNRIRRVLVAAGVYQGTCGKYYGGTE